MNMCIGSTTFFNTPTLDTSQILVFFFKMHSIHQQIDYIYKYLKFEYLANAIQVGNHTFDMVVTIKYLNGIEYQALGKRK